MTQKNVNAAILRYIVRLGLPIELAFIILEKAFAFVPPPIELPLWLNIYSNPLSVAAKIPGTMRTVGWITDYFDTWKLGERMKLVKTIHEKELA